MNELPLYMEYLTPLHGNTYLVELRPVPVIHRPPVAPDPRDLVTRLPWGTITWRTKR